MSVKIAVTSNITGILTTDHSSSSYGLPVLLVDGIAYGQADKLPLGDIANFIGDNDAANVVRSYWLSNTGLCSKLPCAEYNLIAKFIGADLAHGKTA